jgi:hypothetical protein
VKEISPNIKIFVWFSAVYASFWQHYAPRTKGGDGDARKYYEQDWNKEADQSKFGNNFLAYYVHVSVLFEGDQQQSSTLKNLETRKSRQSSHESTWTARILRL